MGRGRKGCIDRIPLLIRQPKSVDLSSALGAFRTPFCQTDSSAWFSSHPLHSTPLSPVRPSVRPSSLSSSVLLSVLSVLLRPSSAISTPHLPFLVEMHEHLLSGRIRTTMCIFLYRVGQRDGREILQLLYQNVELHFLGMESGVSVYL